MIGNRGDRALRRPLARPRAEALVDALWGARATLALVAINALIFAIGGGHSSPWAMRASDVFDGSVWQLWTSTFLHVDISHLAQNMASLLVFGTLVTRAGGRRAFLLLYTACGVVASAAFVFLSAVGFTNPSAVCLGSSGCILGLVAAASVLPRDPRTRFGAPLWLLGLGAAAWYIWSVWAGDRGSDVIHLAGMAAGAALASVGRIRGGLARCVHVRHEGRTHVAGPAPPVAVVPTAP